MVFPRVLSVRVDDSGSTCVMENPRNIRLVSPVRAGNPEDTVVNGTSTLQWFISVCFSWIL